LESERTREAQGKRGVIHESNAEVKLFEFPVARQSLRFMGLHMCVRKRGRQWRRKRRAACESMQIPVLGIAILPLPLNG